MVLFCGAGISYSAGLPGFSGLVRRLYAALGVSPDPVQKAAIKAGQYDTAIGLLEGTFVGGREAVRKALVPILTPDLSLKEATTTHEAILTLGKCRDGHTRLITTNFDRLFEEAIALKKLSVESFQAPLLPVPKNRWDGLVYLHGLLRAAPTSTDLNRLVLSSGDFGLAYLTERWAARFASELFRNYVVCFVGYSIKDPVLRYMMDALAADRLLGESSPQAYVFDSFSPKEEKEREAEWCAKGLIPILYHKHRKHAYLHRTLRAWAETYRDGVRGKERIVVECARARPLGSTKQDDFVGRLLWALSDEGGLPAKHFAEIDPVPTLEWLEPLSVDRYRHQHLHLFGVPPRKLADEKLVFSVLRRPAPYDLAPQMALVDAGFRGSRWDKVMRGIAKWLLRHLDDPNLLLWLARHGGLLSDELGWLIGHRLDDLVKMERDGKLEELARIKAKSPNAVPRPSMLILWRLLISGRVKTREHSFSLYRWRDRFICKDLTSTARLELREALKPLILLREPFRWPPDIDEPSEDNGIKRIAECEVVLSSEHVHSTLGDLRLDPNWPTALPELFSDFNSLLRDALDLMREIGRADDRNDHSYLQHPSIIAHSQNRDFRDWTALIELTRDAWVAVAKKCPDRARLEAEIWSRATYPLFRRLAFYAAAQPEIIPWKTGLAWLLAEDYWWLWSLETRREALRLIVFIATKIDESALKQLELAIIAGPPRSMFRRDITEEEFTDIAEREVWLRLAKIASANVTLTVEGGHRLAALSTLHPYWKISPDQRDEFSFWMGDGNEARQSTGTPKKRRELVEWIKENPRTTGWEEDDWRQRCRNNFSTCACALFALSREGLWPVDRWRDALQAWSEDQLTMRSWRYIAPILQQGSDELLNTHAVSWWLKAVAKTVDRREELFFSIADRIFALNDDQKAAFDDEPVTRAINHPIGHATEALLNWWYRRQLEDNQRLPTDLKIRFSTLCDVSIHKYRHARVLLAAHVITLFRVDPVWTKEHLLPLFDWKKGSGNARLVWEAFLWGPRLYYPLLKEIKASFLDTAQHYSDLGKHGDQYVALLTYAALDQSDTFSASELAAATKALPQEGLQEAAQTLTQALEGSGDQRASYWDHRIVRYFHDIWPKTQDKVSPSISRSFGRLCIAAREAFPVALKHLGPWIMSPASPDFLVHFLEEEKLCDRFPEPALDFLDRILSTLPNWVPPGLRVCLKEIAVADSTLVSDSRYIRIENYLRENGGGE